jgi:peptide subunit release factor 1 (eRF1)
MRDSEGQDSNMIATRHPDLQLLLDRPRGAGMVVSCYANTAVAGGFEAHWRQQLKDEARRVRQELADDPEALDEFERQLKLIRGHLESAGERGARGMAVFTAAGWDRALTMDSEVPYDDRLVVDEEPYLVPVIVDDVLRGQYLAVLTDTHHGRIYAARPGWARQLEEVRGDVPRKNKSAGERWGKQQATIARHREDRILHYFKDLAEAVEAAWDEDADRGIILLGEREVLEDFRAFLPKRLADLVVAQSPHAWSGEQPMIEDQVREVVTSIIGAEQRRLLDEIDGRLREGCAVTTGPREVIEALTNGQVRALVLGPDPGEVAWRCKGCHSLFTTEEKTCPYCKAPCDRANLWQEILIRALKHSVGVHFVTPESGRTVPGAIAALLLRDEPQWALAGALAANATDHVT